VSGGSAGAGSGRPGAPLRFLLAVAIGWTLARGAVLLGWQPPPALAPMLPPRPAPWVAPPATMLAAQPARARPTRRSDTPAPARAFFRPDAPVGAGRAETVSPAQSTGPAAPWLLLDTAAPAGRALYSRPGGAGEAAILGEQRNRRPLVSGSAWAFVRGGGRASALSPGGQIGGSQAGVRLLARLDGSGRLSAAGRLSTTLGGIRQSEGAAGLDWAPIPRLAVHLMVERRFAIDRGGRNAWTAGLAGGAYAVPVAPGWRLDGYAEAGVVGARRRDLYGDGAVRVARALDLGQGRSLSLGGGLWGAAQPGAERLDAGPSAVLRLPVAARALAVALDWRERVAGQARPGSGPALTVAADF
jgi:hypothetical protein